MPANTTFTAGAVLTAQQMNNLPWGLVQTTAGGTGGRGFVRNASTDYNLTTSAADVTGMTVTFTAVAGRLYRANFVARAFNGSSAQQVVVYILQGATTVQQNNMSMLASESALVNVTNIFSGLSGSTTIKIQAQTTVNITGTPRFIGASGGANYCLTVEDIGPAS
jgi:hypothetical protein